MGVVGFQERCFQLVEPIRILHCADLHLDRPFPGLDPDAARRRTAELFAAFRRTVDLALERDVQVFLVAGDLFEHRWVRPETLRLIASEFLRLAPRPVLIAPGNHDPLVGGSPYLSFRWPENVRIFGSGWQEISLEGAPCTVLGRGFDRWEVADRPLAQLPRLREMDGRIQILLFHGSADLRGRAEPEEGVYAPFSAAEVEAAGADYVALGHFHLHQVVARRPNGTPLACYPGSPEGLDFGQSGPHGVLVGTVGRDSTQLELVPVGEREFVRSEVDITGCATHEEVADRLRGLYSADERRRHLFQLTLSGRYARDLGELDTARLLDQVQADFYHLNLTVAARPDWDLDAVCRGRDLMAAFARRLRDAAAAATDPRERRRLEQALYLGLEALEREVAR